MTYQQWKSLTRADIAHIIKHWREAFHEGIHPVSIPFIEVKKIQAVMILYGCYHVSRIQSKLDLTEMSLEQARRILDECRGRNGT